MTGRIFFSHIFYGADWKSLMDKDFLQEMAAEVREVAIQDQPLSYVEVVADYEDEPWYLWIEIMTLFTNIP